MTVDWLDLGANILISTHTLTWSVTTATIHDEYIASNFNSHAHVERDP